MRTDDAVDQLAEVWKAVVATGASHPDEGTRARCRDLVARTLASIDGVAPLEEFADTIAALAHDPLEPLEIDADATWAAWALLHGSAFMHLRISGRAVLVENAGRLLAYRRGRLVAVPVDPAATSERSRAGAFLVRRFDCWNARAARGGFANASLVERDASVGGGVAIQVATPARWRRRLSRVEPLGRIAIGSDDLLAPWIDDESARAAWSSDGEALATCGARFERTSSTLRLVADRPATVMRLMARFACQEHLVLGGARRVGYLWEAAHGSVDGSMDGSMDGSADGSADGAAGGTRGMRFCRAFELAPPEWAQLQRMRPIEVDHDLRLAIARWYGAPRAWVTPSFLQSIGPIGRST